LASAPLPKFVKQEFERFLDCGVLFRGAALLVCEECPETRVIALSCKGRAFCPSSWDGAWSRQPQICRTTAAQMRPLLIRKRAAPSDKRGAPSDPADPESSVPHEGKSNRPRRCGWRRWAELLKRSFDIDVRCGRCNAIMKLKSLLTSPKSLQRLLAQLGEPTDVPGNRGRPGALRPSRRQRLDASGMPQPRAIIREMSSAKAISESS